jgi:iron complex outermembrane recepter protein
LQVPFSQVRKRKAEGAYPGRWVSPAAGYKRGKKMTGTHIRLRTSTALSVLALIGGGGIYASAAQAQTTTGSIPTDQTKPEPDTESAEIVVTGSLIPHDNFSSPEPLTVITRDEMTMQGFSSIADALQGTAVTQGADQINNLYGGYVVDGGTGVNTIGLRGLGATRTLVLLNGHRLSPAGTRGSVGSVDLNTIPNAIVKRVEILKAGASSIYGSDAVAGVINILTENDLDGFVFDAQTNVPEGGSGTANRVSLSYGTHGDRWRLLGSFDYYNRDRVTLGDTKYGDCPIGGYLDGEGTAMGSGDYIDPSTGKSKCWTIDNGGVTINTLGVKSRAATAADGQSGTTFNRLRPNASITTGNTPGVGSYTRTSYDPAMQDEEVLTPLRTYTGFLSGGYDLHALGDAEVYFEFLGNRRQSSSTSYRQLTLDYATGSLLVPTMFRNDVYSSATETTNGQTAAVRAFIGYGTTTNTQDVYTYRTAGGLRGSTGIGDWRYDLYGSYSWMRSTYTNESFITSKIAQSMDVVQNSDGSFSCRDTSNGCVAAPEVNATTLSGNLSSAYRDWITDVVKGRTSFDEVTASANLNGSLFALPGGAAKGAIGVEYRHDSLNDQPSAQSVAGDLYNYTSSTPTVGTDEVWEVFGELYLPVLADLPLIKSLTLDASGRYTHYRSYGGEWTYKGSVNYQPVKGVAFRGSYGTSYRAPALFEQYLGATSGFLSGSYDPCDDYASSTSPVIKANCAAAGLPADFSQNSSVTVLSAGGAETGLKAETSKNFSAGIVLNPKLWSWAGQVSVSLDYFAITVNDEVSRLGASNLLNLCYGAGNYDPDAGYCRYVSRDANGTLTVQNNYINISTDKRRGWEFNFNYRRDLFGGEFSFNALITKYLEQSTQLFSDEALIDANGTISSPDWTGSFSANYRIGKVGLHWGMDWTNGSSNDDVARYLATGSDGKVDEDSYNTYKEYYYLGTPDYFLHNASITYDLADNFKITGGVRNVFDTETPEITSGVYSMTGNSPIYSGYDYIGRTFYMNVTARF